MEPDYVSYQAQRQSQIEYLKAGGKRAFYVQQAQETSVVQAEHLRSFDSHAKTQEFISMTTGKGLSRRQRREQRRKQMAGARASSLACTSASSHPPPQHVGPVHPGPPQPVGPAHPSQAEGIQPANSCDNSFGLSRILPVINLHFQRYPPAPENMSGS